MADLFEKLRGKPKRKLKIPAYLSAEDKKKVAEIIKNAEKHDDVPHSTQDSIPFDRMFQEGN